MTAARQTRSSAARPAAGDGVAVRLGRRLAVLELGECRLLPPARLRGAVGHHHELIPLDGRLDGVQVGELYGGGTSARRTPRRRRRSGWWRTSDRRCGDPASQKRRAAAGGSGGEARWRRRRDGGRTTRWTASDATVDRARCCARSGEFGERLTEAGVLVSKPIVIASTAHVSSRPRAAPSSFSPVASTITTTRRAHATRASDARSFLVARAAPRAPAHGDGSRESPRQPRFEIGEEACRASFKSAREEVLQTRPDLSGATPGTERHERSRHRRQARARARVSHRAP